MAANYKDPVSWPFLPKPHNGQLKFPSLDRSVSDAMRIILTTRPGEQLMLPRFGAGLQDFLDEGNTLPTRARIQAAILSSLQTYEARIVVDRIDVDPVPNAPTEVHVQIYYRLLRTNASQQLGLTMTVG